MSNNFEMLVDVDVTLEEAEGVSHAVLDCFRKLGLIAGTANSDCVLGTKGYRPGPAVVRAYRLQKEEGRFWELLTCGVEPQVGRGFNGWALGAVCEGFTCSSCGARIEPFGQEFGDSVGDSIREWMKKAGPALLRCPRCGEQRSIAKWECKPPLGFGNLSFRFWNWPPLDSSSWALDIGGIMEEVTGHTIASTYGHI